MEPLLTITIAPNTTRDAERLRAGLETLMAEDRAIHVGTDRVTGATVVGGASEHHLEIILHRLAREFGVTASVGRPQIAYKETLTRSADGERKISAVLRGRHEYAHVKIHVDPGARGSGYVFHNSIIGGAIPARFIASVDDGIKGALTCGTLAGYPVVDVRVELFDGSYHDIDSSDFAFQIAGSLAFQDAAKQAEPILLEPFLLVEVRVPRGTVGASEDIVRRRGRIRSEEQIDDVQVIHARAPLSGMFGYSSDLRSRTAGRATFEMRADGYEPAHDKHDGGPDALGVPALRRTPPPTLGPLGMALSEPDDQP